MSDFVPFEVLQSGPLRGEAHEEVHFMREALISEEEQPARLERGPGPGWVWSCVE